MFDRFERVLREGPETDAWNAYQVGEPPVGDVRKNPG
jgi:hypothetical protein